MPPPRLSRRQASIAFLGAPFAHGARAAVPGVGDSQLLIGQTITLQDGKNAYGVAAREGVQLVIDAANAAGGVHGRKLVLRVLDDQNKPSQAEANAKALAAEGVFMLFGSLEGGPSTAVAKVADAARVPFFGPMAGSPTLRRPHLPMVFPVRAEHRDEFRALMAYGKSLGQRSVAFLHADSDVGRAHLANVGLLAAELGLPAPAGLPFKGEASDADIAALAAQIVQRRPDMVFNHGSAGIYQRVVAQARAAGSKANLMGVNSGSSQIADRLGDLAKGMVFAQIVPSPWERKHAISREYQDAAQRGRSAGALSYAGLEGFATAKALVMALRAAGGALTREGLVAALYRQRFDLGGMTAGWRPGDHEGSRYVDLSLINRSGQFMH